MNEIKSIWKESKSLIETKKLHQIISFIGDGVLSDNNETSIELRGLLSSVPSSYLKKYIDECLNEKFKDSGFVLQDIINQIGERLGFEIEHGLYRGRTNSIGFDGIWKSKNGTELIIEVKTTDAYRINLDVIAEYREKLIESNKISESNSSILIVVGRQDTGDMEAQIRGSKHAWDIRIISAESLLLLLEIKEKLNDPKTTNQIVESLKPLEYTRLDKLIELIFLTAKDMELDDETESDLIQEKGLSVNNDVAHKEKRFTPVNFHMECLEKISESKGLDFIKQGRVSFHTKDKKIGLIISISKRHEVTSHDGKYWFAFHPYQKEYLSDFEESYCAYGCENSSKLFLIPISDMNELTEFLWTTENEERMYWHIVIFEDNNSFKLQVPKKDTYLDINKYRVS